MSTANMKSDTTTKESTQAVEDAFYRHTVAQRNAAWRDLENLTIPRPASEWCEGLGAVLWWRLPVEEPPYVGSPLDKGFPASYFTHFTLLPTLRELPGATT